MTDRIRIIKHEARHIAKLARRMKRAIKPCKLGEVQASAAPVATVRLPGACAIRRYLILLKQSFSRSISELTWVSIVPCNASVPLLDNSAEAFLSRFSFQSRIASLVALCASAAALWYTVMHASAFEQVLHSS